MRSLFTLSLIAATLFAPALPQADAAEMAPAVIDSATDGSAPVDSLEDLASRRSVIAGHDVDSWTLTLRAGVTYEIIVDGDGDSDLDAVLRDENGNLIDSDLDDTDFCVLTVTPRWSGPFTLEIRNLGRRANLYEIRLTP